MLIAAYNFSDFHTLGLDIAGTVRGFGLNSMESKIEVEIIGKFGCPLLKHVSILLHQLEFFCFLVFDTRPVSN